MSDIIKDGENKANINSGFSMDCYKCGIEVLQSHKAVELRFSVLNMCKPCFRQLPYPEYKKFISMDMLYPNLRIWERHPLKQWAMGKCQ